MLNVKSCAVYDKNCHHLSSPRNVKEFYPFAIHTIYAVILAFSFDIAGDVFVPIFELQKFPNFVNATALVFTYMVLISGWIGYAKSISKRPHRPNNAGTARFIIDLIIAFLIFYLINLTKSQTFTANFAEAFIWVLPMLFSFYVIWDRIRIIEYRDVGETVEEQQIERKILMSRSDSTMASLLFVIGQSILFVYFMFGHLVYFFNNLSWFYLLFICISSGIIITYRIWKWDIPPLKRGAIRRLSDDYRSEK